MDDADRKMLTEEVLWEEWDQSILAGGLPNRTFTDPKDTFDLKKKIVVLGVWREFMHYSKRQWHLEKYEYWSDLVHSDNFTNWLIDQIRFPELVANWWKERKVKG